MDTMARPPQSLPQTRSYQEEMLTESLKRNVIIAMDTGSGKTHIAVLRIKNETERNAEKISWFIAPTVALCEQQRDVIAKSLGVPVGLVSGAQMPDQWSNVKTWKTTLENHKVIVSTPQVLLDALRHGYVIMSAQISLIIFDEAHHAADKHPYNVIMREFYDKCPPLGGGTREGDEPKTRCRPFILGLTASPMFGGNVTRAFEKLEVNLDSAILTPQATRDDLMRHVYRPKFSNVRYPKLHDDSWRTSRNTRALERVYMSLNIEKDPQICSMRSILAKPNPDRNEQKRIDQRLSQALNKKDTFVHKGMRDFLRTAQAICVDIGVWAADWFVASVVNRALKGDAEIIHQFFLDRKQREKAYLVEVLRQIEVDYPAVDDESIAQGCSSKAKTFITCVANEKAVREARNEDFSGLTFITRRDGALALSEVLRRHPLTKAVFNIGTLLGGSESSHRNSFLDITHTLLRESHSEVISDFRVGERNLVIATAVAEEGLDIQACCAVIRWDPPQNMVSWAQSRGRARRKESSLILLAEEGAGQEEAVRKWEAQERQMIEAYNNEERLRNLQLRQLNKAIDEDGEYGDYDEFGVEETGAKVTLDSAISHIAHFCNILPSRERAEVKPTYDITPPDYPVAFHSLPPALRRGPKSENLGPFGATLTLPRLLPQELRTFKTEEIHPTKKAAQRQVAFDAYKALYNAHLLNDNLLPIGSTIHTLQDEEVKELLREVQKRDGVASVLQEIDPWVAESTSDGSNSWWANVVKVEGLTSFQMFSRKKVPQLDFTSDCLYDSSYGIRHFSVQPGKGISIPNEELIQAETFTRRIFSIFYGGKLGDTSQLSYLFLPTKGRAETDDDKVWEERRAWACKVHDDSGVTAQDHFLVNAGLFGDQYDHPTDISMISSGGLYLFKRWKFEQLSQDEQDMLRKKYSKQIGFKIEYPAIIGERLAPRRNFLTVLPSPSAPLIKREEVLLPQFSEVVLENDVNLNFALFLPSILRAVTIKLTVKSFTESFLNRVLLRKIPLDAVQMALVAPSASSIQNYQRLETVGDAVLKLVTSVHLLQAHPYWPEGYLAKRKDHAVSNACLAKMAINRKLYEWIIRKRFSPKKWKPSYSSQVSSTDAGSQAPLATNSETTVDCDDDELDQNEEGVIHAEDDVQSSAFETLSTKVLADVVEALTGAAFISVGFDGSIEFLDSFNVDIGTPWKRIEDCLDSAIASVGTLDEPQKNIENIEQIIGYTFQRKMLAVEALMHVSSESSINAVSYERMEFLGDAVLDLFVVNALYRAEVEGKVFTPREMHLRKSALVNMHFLAYLCLKADRKIETEIGGWDFKMRKDVLRKTQHIVYMSHCLFHSSTRIIEKELDCRTRFLHCKDTISDALEGSDTFPWSALAHLQAPKFLSDIIESIIGAIYLDSKGDLKVIEAFLDRIGFMRVLRRLVHTPIELRHPVTRITEWASNNHRTDDLELKVEKVGERVRCTLSLEGEILVEDYERYNGKPSEEDVKLRVAEKGIALLDAK